MSRTIHGMSALVDLKNVIVQALGTHLHLGHAEVTQPADFIGRDLVGAGLDDKSHVSVMGGLVE